MQNTPNSGATYDNIRSGMATHCDVVVAASPGQLAVVGGNVDNSVARRNVPISANGLLTRPEYFAVIKLEGAGQPAPPRPIPPAPIPLPPSPPTVRGGRTIYAAIDLD